MQSEAMPVRLRGHHFLCILTYMGLGYSAPFVAAMDATVDAIRSGRPVVLADGPDDICAGLTEACRLASGHDCEKAETRLLDDVAVHDVEALLGRNLSEAKPLGIGEIATLRSAFADGTIRRACAKCPWLATCNTIVAEGFAETRLNRAD